MRFGGRKQYMRERRSEQVRERHDGQNTVTVI